VRRGGTEPAEQRDAIGQRLVEPDAVAAALLRRRARFPAPARRIARGRATVCSQASSC
jgi:hypothetical protein